MNNPILRIITVLLVVGRVNVDPSDEKSDLVELSANKCTEEYFEYGFPPITTKKMFGDPVFLNRNYSVLQNQLGFQGSLYVHLEKLDGVSLHLYGNEHPTAPNYKMDISNLTISKCDNDSEESCTVLSDCRHARVSLSNPADVVSIAWKKTKTAMLLVQHKNNLLRCEDPKKPFQIEKIVLYHQENLKISSISDPFICMDNNESVILNGSFHLIEGDLHLYVLQCAGCEINFNLTCDNTVLSNSTISYNNSSSVVYDDGTFRYGWNEVFLDRPKSSNNCSLAASASNAPIFENIKPFWKLLNRAYTSGSSTTAGGILNNGENSTGDTPRKMYEDKSSCPELTTTAIITIVVLLIVIVVLVVLVRKRVWEFLSNRRRRSEEEERNRSSGEQLELCQS